MDNAQSNWGLWVALYAALVATGGLLWNIISWKKDSPNIKVRITEGLFFTYVSVSVPKVFIVIVNKGRRPITIVSGGFCGKNGEKIFYPSLDGLPKRIEQWESHTLSISRNELNFDHLAYPWKAWVRDATEKVYYSEEYCADLSRRE